MSAAAPSKTREVLRFEPASDRQALYLRRNHQQLQHFINRMLSRLGVPDKAARGVSGIHGMLNGRTDFPVFKAHRWTALQLNYRGGGEEGARKFVYRTLRAVREAERRCGRKFFDITCADGVTQTMTSYDADYIGEAAIWGLLEAKRSGERNLSKAITDELVDRAISRLPECDTPSPEGEPKPLPLADYVRQREPRVLGAIEDFADGVEERGGDSDTILEKLEVEIGRIRRSRLKTRGSRRQPVGEGLRQRELDAALWGGGGDRTDAPRGAEARAADTAAAGAGEGQGGDGIVPPVTSEEASDNDAFSDADMLAWALRYARAGRAVFPLHTPSADASCSCRKADCRSPGKHPRTPRGVKDATADEAQVRAWWGRWPEANIGVATGRASNFVALDVDVRHGGDASLAELFDAHGGVPATAEVVTGGGGFHLLFEHPGVPFKNSSSVLGEGLDVKTDGGYVVAAPSLHASGRRYEWRSAMRPAPLPAWLLELLTAAANETHPRRSPKRRGGPPGAPGGAIPSGSRNDRLFRLACALRGNGAGYEEIEAAVFEAYEARCEKQPLISAEELRSIARSATRYMPN